jgi:hypothetical protein
MSKEEKKKPFIMLDHDVLKYKETKSRLVHSGNEPETVSVTLLDKVLFIYMKTRYDWFTKNRNGYYESYQQIADGVGVEKKSVARFVHKWKEHGFIDYYNGAGNRINYTKMDCMFLGAYTGLVEAHKDIEMWVPHNDYDHDVTMSMWEAGL